jgi:transposase-like protein
MRNIIANIEALAQHLKTFYSNPELYRPDACPNCGSSSLWCHGVYFRKADRSGSGETSLNPTPIPRFYCAACKRTCSVLPECLPARRWYLWATQQLVLLMVLSGLSYRQIAEKSGVSR